MNDFEAIDFFKGDELVADPYPYYEALREQCPCGASRITAW